MFEINFMFTNVITFCTHTARQEKRIKKFVRADSRKNLIKFHPIFFSLALIALSRSYLSELYSERCV